MRVLFLDTFSGISGNMLLGLLIDLGADQQYILSELNKLNIGEYKIIIERVNNCYLCCIIMRENHSSQEWAVFFSTYP